MKIGFLTVALTAGFFLQAAAYDSPALVSDSSLDVLPYCTTGIVIKDLGSSLMVGSGSLINRRCVVTAAHVCFDSDTLTWYTGQKFCRAYNQYIENYDSYGASMAGNLRLSAYSSAAQAKDGHSAFNADILVLYSLNDIGTQTADYSIHFTGTPCLAAERWSALLLGYPCGTYPLAEANPGRMFYTGPNTWFLGDYLSIINADHLHDNLATASDSYGTIYSLYVSDDSLAVYPGNSGGPLFAFDVDDGLYTQTAIVVAGSTTTTPITAGFRVINEAAYQLISSAESTAGASERLFVTVPVVSTASGKPVLNWPDTATGETGWQIRRNLGSGWVNYAAAAANATTFTDNNAPAGVGATYSVRAVSALNRGPWSRPVTASPVGHSAALANAVSAPYLYVSSTGNAPFTASGSRATSGRILNLQSSNLSFPVDGPCVVKFKWQVSCEPTTEGTVCDKFSVYVDDVENSYIDGTVSATSKTVTLSGSGRHTIRFTYAKDDYTTGGTDSASVASVSVWPTSSSETIPGSLASSGNWRDSTWLGTYFNYPSSRWIYSLDLGFAYVAPITESDWESKHQIWLYFPDPAFGWTWTDISGWPWCWSYSKGWMYYLSNGWFWVDSTQRFEQIGTGAVVYR